MMYIHVPNDIACTQTQKPDLVQCINISYQSLQLAFGLEVWPVYS